MGENHGNYHLQYFFDDLHVIYMFFTYYVNFQLFQWNRRHATGFIPERGKGGRGRVLPYMAYTGTCRWTGYGFRHLCPKRGMYFYASLP